MAHTCQEAPSRPCMDCLHAALKKLNLTERDVPKRVLNQIASSFVLSMRLRELVNDEPIVEAFVAMQSALLALVMSAWQDMPPDEWAKFQSIASDALERIVTIVRSANPSIAKDALLHSE